MGSTIKNLMVPIEEYPRINVHANINEAIKILKKNFRKEANNVISGHKTLIVQDNDKTVGIVTLRSLLKAVTIDGQKDNSIASTLNLFKNKSTNSSVCIKDIMRKRNIAHVYENQPITRAIQIMVTKKVNSLLVIENPEFSELTYGEYPLENHKVIGIIRSIDVFDVLGEFLDLDHKVVTFPYFSGRTIPHKT